MTATMMTALLAAALGAAAGAALPAAGERIAAYKCRRKGRVPEPAPRYTGAAARAVCLLCNGIGWGLCLYAGTWLPGVLAAAEWSIGILLILLDLRLRILPNELLAALAAGGLALQLSLHGPAGLPGALFAMLAVGMGFLALGNFMGLYKIGAGDVKLAAIMALALGFPQVFAGLMAMAASMFVFCGIGLLTRRITLKSMVPFGPFLVPGLQIGMLLLLYFPNWPNL